MIQDLFKAKMGRNIGWMMEITTLKRTIKEDNKEIEDNSVAKKE
jgi:hypothetical protein